MKQGTSANKLFGKHTIYRGVIKYMTRWWFWIFRIHIFHAPDSDEDLHDHPWAFITFPLQSYVEEVQEVPVLMDRKDWKFGIHDTQVHIFSKEQYAKYKKLRIVRALRFHYRPAQHTHRVLGKYIETLPSGKIRYDANFKSLITFVIRFKPTQKWGFWKFRGRTLCWQFWEDYVNRGGKNAPCS